MTHFRKQFTVKHFAEKLMLMALCGSIAGWLTHVILNDPYSGEIRPLPFILLGITLIIARVVRHRGDMDKSFMVVTFGSALMVTLLSATIALSQLLRYHTFFPLSSSTVFGLTLCLLSTLLLTWTGTTAIRKANWGNLGIVVLFCYVVAVILPIFWVAARAR